MGMYDWATIEKGIIKTSPLMEKYNVAPEKLLFQTKCFDRCHERYSGHLVPSTISFTRMRHYRFAKDSGGQIAILQEVDKNGEEKTHAIDFIKDEENSDLSTHKIDFNLRLFEKIKYSPSEGQLATYCDKNGATLWIMINFKSKDGYVTKLNGVAIEKTPDQSIVAEDNLVF